MISQAVEMALDAAALTEPDLLQLNGWTLLERLRQSSVPAAASLIECLLSRDLLKRGYVITAHRTPATQRAALVHRYHETRAERHAADERLAAKLGRAPGEVIVYCPAPTVMKEAAARVSTPDGLRQLNDAKGEGFSEIKALEARYETLWRLPVVVPAEIARRAAPAAADIFGQPSEYTFPSAD